MASPPRIGTTATAAPLRSEAPRVWVHLRDVPDDALVVVEGAWELSDAKGGRVLSRGTSYSRSFAELVSSPGQVTLRAIQDGDLRVGTRRYSGRLTTWPFTLGPAPRPRAMVEMDVETYLQGVVAGELPASFPREAQRALAILARTYVLSQPQASREIDVLRVDDSGLTDQEFHGTPASAAHRKIVADAVESTRGLVLHDGARPLRAWYHAICGGHTTDAAPVFKVSPTAPLRGVACTTCVGTKYYRWNARIPGAAVLKAGKFPHGQLDRFRVEERSAEGRALKFRITAGGDEWSVHAADFRVAVGPSLLRSVWLDEVSVVDHDLVVSGRGWGHGVGLCQWGAKGLADRGEPVERILLHYYPGAELRRVW